MADSVPNGSGKKKAVIAIAIVLVVAALLATCQRMSPESSFETPRAADLKPTPTPAPILALRAGLEVAARDEAAGLITIRDKATGDTVQLKLDEATPAAIDQALLIKAKAQAGAVRNPSPSGGASPTAQPSPAGASPPTPTPSPAAGGAAATASARPAETPKAPEFTGLASFVPPYPGAATVSLNAMNQQGSPHGAYVFTTTDTPDAIGKFYGGKAVAAGLVVIVDVAGTAKSGPTFTLIAEDSATNRSLSLTAGIEDGKSRGSIEFVGR